MNESQEPKNTTSSAGQPPRIAGSTATVAAGAVVGQGALFLAAPIISRIYDPADLGVFQTYISCAGVLVVVSSLRYHLAIVLPERDDDAAALRHLSSAIVVATVTITALSGAVWAAPVAQLLGDPRIAEFFWTVPAGVLAAGLQEVYMTWLIRGHRFRALAITRGTDGVAKAIAQTTLGVVTGGPLGLLLGDIVGRGCATLVAWVQVRAHRSIGPTGAKLLIVGRRYVRYAVFGAPGALFNNAGLQASPLLFAHFYGMEMVGWFALGQRVVATPLVLVGQAVAQVYLGQGPRLARSDPDGFAKWYVATAAKLLAMGAAPVLLIAAMGPWLFGLIFGGEWDEAGVYLQIAAIMYLIQFAVTPLSHTLNILGRPDRQMVWDVGRFTLVAGTIVAVGALGLPARVAVGWYAGAMSVAYLALFGLGWHTARRTAGVA